MRRIQFIGLVVLALFLAACTASNLPLKEGATSSTDSTSSARWEGVFEDYWIGPDDMLQVNVWRNPELSVTVPVRPDGMITVPLIGDVQAAGRKPEEVAATIKDELDEYIINPNVTVIVTGLSSHEFLYRVRVTGAVGSPLSIPFRPGMTVLDVVLAAGGVTEFAAPNRTKLYRRTNSETTVIPIRLSQILEQGKLDTNMELLPGDVVTVPERFF